MGFWDNWILLIWDHMLDLLASIIKYLGCDHYIVVMPENAFALEKYLLKYVSVKGHPPQWFRRRWVYIISMYFIGIHICALYMYLWLFYVYRRACISRGEHKCGKMVTASGHSQWGICGVTIVLSWQLFYTFGTFENKTRQGEGDVPLTLREKWVSKCQIYIFWSSPSLLPLTSAFWLHRMVCIIFTYLQLFSEVAIHYFSVFSDTLFHLWKIAKFI